MAVETHGTVRLRGDTGPGVAVRILADEGRLRITSGSELGGEWRVDEIGILALNPGFAIKVEGEEFMLRATRDAERAEELGVAAAAPRLARKVAALHKVEDLPPSFFKPPEEEQDAESAGLMPIAYALAGVLFRVLVNESPPDAVSRMKGDALPAKLQLARGRASESLLRAIEWALVLDEKQRPQDVREWRRALEGQAPVPDTVRLAPQPAPTVISAPPPPKTSPATPPARSRPERSGSGWRWFGIGAVAVVAVLAISSWNKQRSAEMEQPQAARPASEHAPEAKAPKPGIAAQSATDSPYPLRERPGRERADRPGDRQQPAPEEFRKKVAQEFKAADRDSDGHLSRGEVQGRFPFIEREFPRVDSDADGRGAHRDPPARLQRTRPVRHLRHGCSRVRPAPPVAPGRQRRAAPRPAGCRPCRPPGRGPPCRRRLRRPPAQPGAGSGVPPPRRRAGRA